MRKRVGWITGGGAELRQRQSGARTVVVTGGARGIGRAIARRFLQGGDRVHTVDVLRIQTTPKNSAITCVICQSPRT